MGADRKGNERKEEYSMDMASMCWPVMLSTKPPEARLTNCAHWGENGHTTTTSKAHQRPKAFNITYVEKNFSTKAKNTPKGSKRKL